jgi:hypothetical protein
VSSPTDPAEINADLAAAAMVQGAPARVGSGDGGAVVSRVPSASSLEGTNWASGAEVLIDEAQQLAGKLSEIVGVGNNLLKYGGLDLTGVSDRMTEQAEEAIDGEIDVREREINWLESEIDHLEDQDDLPPLQQQRLREHKVRLERCENELEDIEDRKDDELDTIEEKALQAGEIGSAYGVTVANIGMLLSARAHTTTASVFQDLGTGLGKLETACKLGNFAIEYCEQDALREFQRNPNYNSCKAWATKVGEVFDKASGLVSGLPPGWDTVISGALKVPAVVIKGFIAVQDEYYARIDAACDPDPANCGSEMLPEGGTSCSTR